MNLSDEPYRSPSEYTDEASLLHLWHQLVRKENWKEDYLVPRGSSWPNIRVWNGDSFDIGYVNKNDARVNLIVQSPEPPFDFVIGYCIGNELDREPSDARLVSKIRKAYERTEETLSDISDVFDDSTTVYRALVMAKDPAVGNPESEADLWEDILFNSLKQPQKSFMYLTVPDDDSGVERLVRYHPNFPSDGRSELESLLTD
ncbi:hypothetical protein ACFOZ7_15435 [Natribaculum luteum]|uniref:Uncharacterized protein n=1 Tax=Natribaculum luteum TaxID=1586232 RepID=A0ABD5P274_9EURY